jgi:hypothetical protein
MALTTLAHVKLMLGITGTSQDALLTALINSASARIENWCNRKFEAKNCVEWYDGGRAVTVKRNPINSVLRVGVMDGTYFQVQYNGNDPWARVDVTQGLNGDEGSLRLSRSGAVPIIITFVNNTVYDVVNAINAITDWSATFNGQIINGKAAWIPPCAGLDATLSPADIGNGGGPACVPVCMGELTVARWEADSGVIELTGDGQSFNFANQYSIGGMVYSGMGGGIGSTWGAIQDPALSFPRVYQGIVVDYNGGMGTIPDDVQQACVDMVQYMLQQSSNSAMLLQSESLGGYSWTGPGGGIATALSNLDALMKDRLAGYVRFPFAI